MSYRLLTLNAAAASVLAAAPAVAAATTARVRANADGSIDFRPTDRGSPVNLPKGEILRPIGTKGAGRTIGIPADELPTVTAGTKLELTAGKYGWFTLRAVQDLPRGTAGGSVSAK